MNLLKSYFKAFCYSSYYFNTLIKWDTIKLFFSFIGFICAAGKIEEIISGKSYLIFNSIKNYPLCFFILLVIITIFSKWPKLSIKQMISARDIEIEVKVMDILASKSACIISTNTTFDTNIDENIISPLSLQGQFTLKYYKDIKKLDYDIESSIKDQEYESLLDQRIGKKKRYKIGSVATIRPKNRTFYLLAINDMNESGNVFNPSYDNVKFALKSLWKHIETRRINYEKEILIPLIGTGILGIPIKREQLIVKIINSFAFCSSDKKICDRLVIAISHQDYQKYNIDLDSIKDYLSKVCGFTLLHQDYIDTSIIESP